MAPLLARRPATDRAFERVYRRHVGDVYRYVHAVLRDPHDAEDVTQTTFMNAYRAFQRGERPEQAKNWLIAIAHNVCRQRFRQQQRRPAEMPLFEDAAEMAVEEPDDAYTADDIQRALGHLAFNQRAAIVMRELEGRSYAEIAQIMGMSVGAVETLIFRGRRALREQLEGSLTCVQAELALSKQADGMLPRAERGQLRAHLRECKECAAMARRQRATRGALKALGAIPVPSSLASFFGGSSAVATGVAVKAAAVVCAGAVVGTAGYEGARHVQHARPVAAKQKASVVASPVAATPPAAAKHGSAPKLLPAPKPIVPAHPARKKAYVAHGPKSKPKAHGNSHVVVGGAGAPPAAAHHGRKTEAENPVRPKQESENPVARPAPKPKPSHPAQSHKPTAPPGRTVPRPTNPHGKSLGAVAPEPVVPVDATPVQTAPTPANPVALTPTDPLPKGNGHGPK
jgi:RNA polymerase sigma factor (sigma-70 family)